MKINRKQLLQVLNTVSKTLSKVTPETQMSLFSFKNKELIVSTTNLETSIRGVVRDVEYSEDIDYLIDPIKLKSLLSTLDNEYVSLVVKDNEVEIQHSEGFAKFSILKDVSSFPKWNKISKEVEFYIENIKDLLPVLRASSQNVLQTDIFNIKLNLHDNTVDFVGTDANTMAVVSLDVDSPDEVSLVIGKNTLKIPVSLGGDFKVFVTKDNILFSNKIFDIQGVNYEDNYPNYKSLINSTNDFEDVSIPKEDLRNALKILFSITPYDTPVTFDFKDKKCVLSTNDFYYNTKNVFHLTLEKNSKNTKFTIGYNTILNIIDTFQDDNIIFKYKNSSKIMKVEDGVTTIITTKYNI